MHFTRGPWPDSKHLTRVHRSRYRNSSSGNMGKKSRKNKNDTPGTLLSSPLDVTSEFYGLESFEELPSCSYMKLSKYGKIKKGVWETGKVTEQKENKEQKEGNSKEETNESNVDGELPVSKKKKRKRKKKPKKDQANKKPRYDTTNVCETTNESKNVDVSEWEKIFTPHEVLKALSDLGFSTPTEIQVSQILRRNESIIKISSGEEVSWAAGEETPAGSYSVVSVDSNQLDSNSPIEDKLAAARCLHTTGYLFGVFDGHGGPECSQVVSKRLFDYIAASLLPRSELRRLVAEWESGTPVPLTQVFNDSSQFVSGLREIYEASLLNYCHKLLTSVTQDFSMEEALIGAFKQLDSDLSREVQEHQHSEMLESLLRIALSGSVACVGHVDGPHLHIANTGDCGAVLGVQLQDTLGVWRALRLTNDHSWENSSEVNRVLSEHPASEADTVVKDQRLLGLLMPFRAFGDFRFKWDRDTQVDIIEQYIGPGNIIHSCLTPPYLTCEPEISYHRLRPFDRFLILGTDGLWETMSGLDCVTLIGEYMSGRQTLQPVRFPRQAMTLGEISQLLVQRQAGLNLKPVDTNAATHLIRHALGGSDTGLDHGRLSHSLTLSPEIRRYFRDDISIQVIFFDANFLRVCSVEI